MKILLLFLVFLFTDIHCKDCNSTVDKCLNLDSAKNCNALAFCKNKWRETSDMESRIGDEKFVCSICVLVAADIKKMMSDNKTVAEILLEAMFMCKKIPYDNIRIACELSVNSYLKKVVEILVQDISPIEVCKEIHICTSPQYIRPLYTYGHELSKLSPRSANLCKDCKRIISEITYQINSSDTIEDVTNSISAFLCAMCTEKAACRKSVHVHVVYILNMIKKEVEPELICTYLGVCVNEGTMCLGKKILEITQEAVNKNRKTIVINEQSCDQCKSIIKLERLQITNTSSERRITNFLNNFICPKLRFNFNVCKTYVTDYYPMIISILADDDMDEKNVCDAAGFCPTNNKIIRVTPLVAKYTCKICELFLSYIEKRFPVNYNFTEKALMAALDEFAHILPQKYRAEYVMWVNKNFVKLYNLLMKHYANEVICDMIGACFSDNVLSDTLLLRGQPIKYSENMLPSQTKMQLFVTKSINSINGHGLYLVKSTICDGCIFAVNFIKEMIENKKNQEEIISELKKECLKFPKDYQSACDVVVNEYVPQIIDKLESELDPKEICKDLHLCDHHSRKGLVGSMPCTWGPSYWCKNGLTATQCSAYEHCAKKLVG